jgi:hypothetical protein
VPTYIVIALIWIAITIGYWIHTFVVNKANALYLQRSLIMLPIIKIFETLITGLYLNKCPWVISEDPSEKYIDMARISIITLSYTVMLALMYLMSKGWNVIIFQMSRDQATTLTMIMGSVYLAYSAYFLSSDFNSISVFIKLIMAVVYMVLGYLNTKNIWGCLNQIKQFRRIALRERTNDIYLPSI